MHAQRTTPFFNVRTAHTKNTGTKLWLLACASTSTTICTFFQRTHRSHKKHRHQAAAVGSRIYIHHHRSTQGISVLDVTHADRPTLSKVTTYTTNAHIHKHKHTTYTHAPRIRTQAHTYTHHAYTCKHTHHACTHTNTHTHTHTHAHTHTHTPQMPETGDVPSSRGLHSMTAVSPLQGTSPTQLILFGGAPQRGPMVGEAVFTRV